MKCDKHTMLLYAVTDRAWTGRETLRQQVEDALKGGVTCVQLREKELDDAAFLQEAMELSALCRSYGVPFIINDNVEIAIKCHADGIHVGQEDMAAADVRAKVGPDMIIGVSAHSVEEAQLAVAHGADYLGVGAAFDFSAGTAKRAPRWMQECYMEWLYRLMQDPKRLFHRYFTTNVRFVLLNLFRR